MESITVLREEIYNQYNDLGNERHQNKKKPHMERKMVIITIHEKLTYREHQSLPSF